MVVRDLKTKVTFEIGSGFSAADRIRLWKDKPIGRIVKYKSQPVGVKDKPRFPVFLGFRDEKDL
jgi:DNA ligase-1